LLSALTLLFALLALGELRLMARDQESAGAKEDR
jgi:hypothetical protein